MRRQPRLVRARLARAPSRALAPAMLAATLAATPAPAADPLTELEAYASEAGRIVGYLKECGLYDDAADFERAGRKLVRLSAGIIGSNARILVARLESARFNMTTRDISCEGEAHDARLSRHETARARLMSAMKLHMDDAAE